MNLRKEAKGRGCMVRIPGVCNHNSETVVLAHVRLLHLEGMARTIAQLEKEGLL